MEYAAILFVIFGVLVIFAGIYVHRGHGDIFPRMYSVRNDPAYLRYLGNKIIIAGFLTVIFSVAFSFLEWE